MQRYNLTGSQKFYGINDPKTYYNVPGTQVWHQLNYMCLQFNLQTVFIYQVNRDGNFYVGCYSDKWKNIRTADGKLHSVYNF